MKTRSSVSLANDIHAIYCAFAEDGGWVYVKVGMSVRPAQRAKAIVCGSPFDIKRFVFCHIGGMKVARSFELILKHMLREHHTRGEWYRFSPEMSGEFKQAVTLAYCRALGFQRAIKWSELRYEDYHVNPWANFGKA